MPLSRTACGEGAGAFAARAGACCLGVLAVCAERARGDEREGRAEWEAVDEARRRGATRSQRESRSSI
eukprot:3812928-Pleurochrysis_carterae.AAC.1